MCSRGGGRAGASGASSPWKGSNARCHMLGCASPLTAQACMQTHKQALHTRCASWLPSCSGLCQCLSCYSCRILCMGASTMSKTARLRRRPCAGARMGRRGKKSCRLRLAVCLTLRGCTRRACRLSARIKLSENYANL